MRRKVAVLGSTGSIGTQALEVIEKSPELQLHSIVCRSSVKQLKVQTNRYNPTYAASVSEGDSKEIFKKAVDGCDLVLNAIVGSAGLQASLLAQTSGIPLALANKESLVIGKDLLKRHLDSGMVIPVDSEHSTIFRCLLGEVRTPRGITLTASGGSMRDVPIDKMADATVEAVLKHPTWEMGGRITVDSATMVNKAFEVLEAMALFPGIPVDVVIHRSSIVHSFVETADGAWKALMGLPDMRIPISWALNYPDLPVYQVASESPLQWGAICFEPVNADRYPAFFSVLQAGRQGGTTPAAANAADEVAVEAFIRERISFGSIPRIISETIEKTDASAVEDFNHLLEVDKLARKVAWKAVESCSP